MPERKYHTLVVGYNKFTIDERYHTLKPIGGTSWKALSSFYCITRCVMAASCCVQMAACNPHKLRFRQSLSNLPDF
jgi:hypothetical protein